MRRMPQARGHKARYREEAFYELEKVAKQRMYNNEVRLEMKAGYIGNKIFEAHDLCKAYGDVRILDHFSYIFARYEKVGAAPLMWARPSASATIRKRGCNLTSR